MQEGVGSEGGVAPRPPRHSKAPGLCRLEWQCCAWSTKKGTELTTRQAAVCDGGPRGGEEADWAHLQVPLHGSGARVGPGPIRGVGSSSPNTCPFNSHCFQQGFSLSSLTNQAEGGAQRGKSTRDAICRDCPSTDTGVDTPLPVHSCAQRSCPHPGTRVNTCQAPWALAASSRAGRGQCGLATSPPGTSSLPPPLPPSPQSCLSGLIWGFFSGG